MARLDPTSEDGAAQLADRLVAHWAAKGEAVRAWAVKRTTDQGATVWGVETDLVNGLPRRRPSSPIRSGRLPVFKKEKT